MLPELVRRSILKKRSAAAAELAEQAGDLDDDVLDDVVPPEMTTMQLRELRVDLESRMDKKVQLGSKKGITTIRSRYARNFSDASDDPTQFDGWVRPDDEDDVSDDEEDEKLQGAVDATAATAAAAVGPLRIVSVDRVFCPVLQASGLPCKANYKHVQGKSMKKHVLTHCPDGCAAEGALLWAQFIRDGEVCRPYIFLHFSADFFA